MPCRMFDRGFVAVIALAAGLLALPAGAQVVDFGKYPDWKGQWSRAPVPGVTSFTYGPPWDTSKPEARGQQAPLTPEYQAIFEANLADQAAGGTGTWYGHTCRGHGMPTIMSVYFPMEIVVLPETTYIVANDVHVYVRRVLTDGREWQDNILPTYLGISLGKWIDEDGDGRFDTLEIETRGFKGPRAVDLSGIPLHEDNQTIIKERIYLDKADKNVLHNQITIFDHALTQPWTVTKDYRRNANPRAYWPEQECAEGSGLVQIGKETYMMSADGHLMLMKMNQQPPDLRYFAPARKQHAVTIKIERSPAASWTMLIAICRNSARLPYQNPPFLQIRKIEEKCSLIFLPDEIGALRNRRATYVGLGSWLPENAVAFKTGSTNFLRNAIMVFRIYQRGRFLIDLRKSIFLDFRLAGFSHSQGQNAKGSQ